MVVGVVPHVRVGVAAAAHHNATRTSVADARGFHRVFAVEVAVLAGKYALVVAKMTAVFVGMIEGAAREDIVGYLVGFGGQGIKWATRKAGTPRTSRAPRIPSGATRTPAPRTARLPRTRTP